jgi:hypothetical protein
MYLKMKNTLAGLSMVAAFMLGSVLISEPVPAEASRPQATTQTEPLDLALAVMRHALTTAEAEARAQAEDTAEQAKSAARARSARVRLELGMPYYSFGAMLPRRRES